MGRRAIKQKKLDPYVVISYIDGDRRIHKVSDASSYRDAKRQVARDLREELGLWDTNLADITSQGMMIARRVPRKLL